MVSVLYRTVFRLTATITHYSASQVSSNKMACLSLTDQIIIAGIYIEIVICGGKILDYYRNQLLFASRRCLPS